MGMNQLTQITELLLQGRRLGMKTIRNGRKNPIPFLFSYYFSRKRNRNDRLENGNDIDNIGNIGNGTVGTESTDIGRKSKIHDGISGVWHNTHITVYFCIITLHITPFYY